jgi:tRNA A37 threonylcarbamoyladenosine modification protein TsaB
VGSLDALLCGDGVDVACIDARRGEVFCKGAGIDLCAIAPAHLAELITPGSSLAGDGAVRYRVLLEPAAVIAPDASPLHTPWARHHASLCDRWIAPEPIYVRAPDADRSPPARAAS